MKLFTSSLLLSGWRCGGCLVFNSGIISTATAYCKNCKAEKPVKTLSEMTIVPSSEADEEVKSFVQTTTKVLDSEFRTRGALASLLRAWAEALLRAKAHDRAGRAGEASMIRQFVMDGIADTALMLEKE